jgi:hypothetical protein
MDKLFKQTTTSTAEFLQDAHSYLSCWLTVMFPAVLNHMRGDDNPNVPSSIMPNTLENGGWCALPVPRTSATTILVIVKCIFWGRGMLYVDMFAHKESALHTEIGIDSQRLLLIIKGNPTSS